MAEPWEELYAQWGEQSFRTDAIVASAKQRGFRAAFTRWINEATPEQRASVTSALGKQIPTDWTAAIAVALLGDRSYTGAILKALASADALEFNGYRLALQTMADESAVPALLAMLEARNPKHSWGVASALQIITRRAPLVDRYESPEQFANAALEAWKRPALHAPALRNVQCAGRSATFGLDHGGGELRIANTPYDGGSWPTWNRALYVNDAPLYDLSSGCETCRTILQLSNKLSDAASLDRYRAALPVIDAVDEATLEALHPLIDRLQTGHYLASLIDLAIARVDDPARSWLANYIPDEARNDDANQNDGDGYAPRTAHFQSRDRAKASAQNAFVLLVPGQDLARIDEARVSEYERAIRDGARPAAIALTWVEDRPTDWEGETTVRAVLGMILDGHHKLTAYARVGVPARIVTLTTLDESTTHMSETPPERAVREAFAALSAA